MIRITRMDAKVRVRHARKRRLDLRPGQLRPNLLGTDVNDLRDGARDLARAGLSGIWRR
jgi:hypothetical protein